MKIIKHLLTITLALLTLTATQAFAADPATGPYAYPYAERDLRTEIGKGPVVLELFSTQACVFCPTADQYFADLLKNTDIIGLACHVDYFDVKEGSLATPVCSKRQYAYVDKLPDSIVYTPQMIVNGRRDVVGYEYEDVVQALTDAGKNPPQLLPVEDLGGNQYGVDLPKMKLNKDPATVSLITYAAPQTVKIASGANRGKTMYYPRVVSDIVDLKPWDGSLGTLKFDWSPGTNQLGFVLMVQSASGAVLAVATHERAAPIAAKPATASLLAAPKVANPQ